MACTSQMATNKSSNDTLIWISVQVNGEKTARVQCALSKTVSEFRNILLSEKVQLPRNVQFLDAKDYPMSITNEKSFQINNLVTSNDDENIIKLRAIEPSNKVGDQSSTTVTVLKTAFPFLVILFSAIFLNTSSGELFIHDKLCPTFIELNISVLVDKYQCSIEKSTTDSLIDDIKQMDNGIKILITKKNGFTKIEPKVYNQEYAEMINGWINNRSIYQKDYEWYNTMKSPSRDCKRKFDERVEFSMKRIKDTTNSIETFSKNAFKDWPQNLIDRIDLINQVDGFESVDNDSMSFEYNGKIRDNMYLVAWKRENDTIRIQTYIIIFERTAGNNCKFNEEFWSNNRERINNAKKYFLLLKIESNPVFKEFLLRRQQIE